MYSTGCRPYVTGLYKNAGENWGFLWAMEMIIIKYTTSAEDNLLINTELLKKFPRRLLGMAWLIFWEFHKSFCHVL